MNMSDCRHDPRKTAGNLLLLAPPCSDTGSSQSPGPHQIEDGQKPGATEGPSMLKKESGNRKRFFFF